MDTSRLPLGHLATAFARQNPIFSIITIIAVGLSPVTFLTDGGMLQIIGISLWFIVIALAFYKRINQDSEVIEAVKEEKAKFQMPKNLTADEVTAFMLGVKMTAYAKNCQVTPGRSGNARIYNVVFEYGDRDISFFVMPKKMDCEIQYHAGNYDHVPVTRDFIKETSEAVDTIRPKKKKDENKPQQQNNQNNNQQKPQAKQLNLQAAEKAADNNTKFDIKPIIMDDAKRYYMTQADDDKWIVVEK